MTTCTTAELLLSTVDTYSDIMYFIVNTAKLKIVHTIPEGITSVWTQQVETGLFCRLPSKST